MNCIFSVTTRRWFGLRSATVYLFLRFSAAAAASLSSSAEVDWTSRPSPLFSLWKTTSLSDVQKPASLLYVQFMQLPPHTGVHGYYESKILTYQRFGESVPGQRRMPAKSFSCLSFNRQAQTTRAVQRKELAKKLLHDSACHVCIRSSG
ncbi:uncharacterized protein BDW70DRAFT_134807 [Aspergillus foveolatus]|uniref:uncharacterized protein n=1 Tax=Aspergillus foveolatus TaxID=210207 RepID=UPI003CCD61AF